MMRSNIGGWCRGAFRWTFAIALTGCLDEPTVPVPRPSGEFALKGLQVDPKTVPSGESLFAELTKSAPTSAGFFFDASGRIVVNVTSPTDGPMAVVAVRNFLARGDIVLPNPVAVSVLWRPVRHSFSELAAIRALLFDSAYAQLNLASLDLDEARNLVSVGTASTKQAAVAASINSLLSRNKADSSAVAVAEGKATQLSMRAGWLGYFTWWNLTAQGDPVVAGLEVGSTVGGGWGCSVGFIADYPSGGGRGLVTASHCTTYVGGSIWAVDGYAANQHPAGPFIGNEVGDPPPWGCGVFHLCRRSDDSFYRNMSSRVLERGLIARPNAIGGSLDWDPGQPYFIIVGSSNGLQGQELWKIGRVSGWRVGTITNTCVNFNLTGYWPPGYERTVVCGAEATNFNEHGDSGGPLFLSAGGPYVYLSGTTMGRPEGTNYTRFSTMSQIQLDFANTLGVDRLPTLGAPVVAGSILGSTPRLSWSAIGGATTYGVYKQTTAGGPFAYLASTSSTSYTDPSVAAIAVLSGPPSGGVPFAAYQLKATNASDVSSNSNTVYFQRPAAIAVTIEGQFGVKPYEGCYWTANVSGGSGSYTYQWSVNGGGSFPNSPQVYYHNSGSNFTLAVTVTDGVSMPGSDQKSVSVSSANPTCGF